MKNPRTRPKTTKTKKISPDGNILTEGLDRLFEGFEAHSEAKVPFRRLHSHDHIEVSINEFHPVVALFGGERMVLPPDHLVVFWAARPHGPIETTPGGWAYGIHIPLPWVLQWRLPPLMMCALFAGRVIVDPPGDRPKADLELIKNWIDLMGQGSEEARRIVLLEVEARLRRLAIDLCFASRPNRGLLRRRVFRPALDRFEKMATLIAFHFHEPLMIPDIAEAVHMTPASAMRLFRKYSGMTLHEYLMQHRVSNAQRLLSTTDMKIDVVADRSGFGSPARFYACFQQVVGQSPAAYRRACQLPMA